jgi:hypothetical protein
MATVSIWSNVGVTLESALGGALTLTGITKANPGVATSVAHGLNDGDFVLLSVQGMSQVDNRVFRVANKTADTFQLEGENTTSYGTFSAGSAYKITFGTTLATLTSLSASGGDFEFIDTTTIHDVVRTQIPGVASPATYSFESVWDVSDAGLVALKAAADNKDTRAVQFSFANGQKVLFNGYVGATLLPVGNAQDKVTTPVVITMYGRPTTYAS